MAAFVGHQPQTKCNPIYKIGPCFAFSLRTSLSIRNWPVFLRLPLINARSSFAGESILVILPTRSSFPL
ncbi:hypothetical protein BDZ91DRAFT_716596 [Kalaharituber pfeilii]|nr:hypothetical protein BDZ91DRAFT_716596 [Kalaharituber pfeilii]